MKVVMIEDKDAKALVEKLKLKRFETCADTKLGTVESIHRIFHYEVVSWLQDQGCNLQ